MVDGISIKRYNEDYKEIWNKFNKDSKKSLFMFDRNYMDYHSDRFVDHSLLFFYDEELVAILPMSEKGKKLISHGGLTYGGFIISDKMKQTIMLECMDKLCDYIKEMHFEGVVYKCIPYIYWNQPAEEDQYALYRMGAKLMKIEASTVINLKKPLDMAKLRKRMIKKAIKNEVMIFEETSEESYNEFIELQNKVLNAHHGVNAVHSSEELFLLHTRFPNNIRLFSARLEGEMIAGTVLYEYNNVVHTQYLAASDKSRKIGALDYVVSFVIEKYLGKKDWLDFGISTEDDGLVLNEGLISQKEGFGGRTITYNTWSI